MKKVLLFLLCFSMLTNAAFSQTLETGISFDWITKTQMQRDENIQQIHDLLFSADAIKKYPKTEFKRQFADFLKDKNHINNYFEIANGKKEDETKKYCGFFMKSGLLVVYGIQYKNNMQNIYYYDAIGRLQYVDIFSENYPEFPYYSSQYRVNGELVGRFYYASEYDQYIFNSKGKFSGRWYKENMYNRNAKVIMTRSNY